MNTWAFFERLIATWLISVAVVEIAMAFYWKRAHMSMYWVTLLVSVPFLACFLYILPTMTPVAVLAFWLLYRYSKWLSNIGSANEQDKNAIETER